MTVKSFLFWVLLVSWVFHLYWFFKKTPLIFYVKTWIQISALFSVLFIVPLFNAQVAYWVNYGFKYMEYPFKWIIYGLKNLW